MTTIRYSGKELLCAGHPHTTCRKAAHIIERDGVAQAEDETDLPEWLLEEYAKRLDGKTGRFWRGSSHTPFQAVYSAQGSTVRQQYHKDTVRTS